jgi:hypothetical protein
MTRLAIPSEGVQLVIIGPTNYVKASRVQRVTINNELPTNDVFELGSASSAGLSQDTPNITVTFSAFEVGIKIFGILAGKDITSFPAGGASITDLGQADVIINIKDAVETDYVKSTHAKKLQVRDLSFSYAVDAESTEDYTLIGSTKRWFKNDVIVDRFTAGGPLVFTLSETPLVLKNGEYLLSVIVDGEYFDEVDAPAGEDEYSIAGTTLTLGTAMASQVLAVYHANPAGDSWADVSDADVPASIKGKDVVISIAANDIPRVQNVTINGNLNVQAVKELGNRDIVGYQRQVPTVEGTITVLDTDTELISLLTTGVLSGAGVYEYSLGESCPTSGVSLTIELRDPCDFIVPYTVMKTVYIDAILPVGESWTSNVNNNASQTWNWKALYNHLVVYSGAMYP